MKSGTCRDVVLTCLGFSKCCRWRTLRIREEGAVVMKGGVLANMTLHKTMATGARLRYYARVERGRESTVEDGKLNIANGKLQAFAQRRRHGYKKKFVF
jgi:hypothetical protein